MHSTKKPQYTNQKRFWRKTDYYILIKWSITYRIRIRPPSSLSNYLNIPVWSVDDVACYDADAMVRQCDGDGDTVKTRWQWYDGMRMMTLCLIAPSLSIYKWIEFWRYTHIAYCILKNWLQTYGIRIWPFSSLQNHRTIEVCSDDDVASHDADAMVRQCDGDGD